MYNEKVSSIASDGTFIYIHTFQKGLIKVGTGYGKTINGYIYTSNPNYRKLDKHKSIVCIKGKLYYLISRETSYSLLSSHLSNNSISQTQEKIHNLKKEDKSKIIEDEELKKIQIAIINTTTLQEEKIIILKDNISTKSYLISDGIYLYLLLRQKKDQISISTNEYDSYIVEVYDPDNLENNSSPIKIIELSNKNLKGFLNIYFFHYFYYYKEAPFSLFQWERASMYTTGFQLAALIPNDYDYNFSRIRVFSLINGNFITNYSLTNKEPLSKNID